MRKYNKTCQQLKCWDQLKKFSISTSSDRVMTNVVTQLPNRQITQCTFYELFNIFSIPTKIAANLTHYNVNNNFEWSEFSFPNNFMHLNFSSLTHLKLFTKLPLELLLTRFELCKLQCLSFLVIDSYYHELLDRCETHKPLSLLPLEPKNDPIFPSLRTLQITHVPHGAFQLASSLFPCLEYVELQYEYHETYFKCENCKNGRIHYRQCHAQFLDSLLKWNQLNFLSYNSKKVF